MTQRIYVGPYLEVDVYLENYFLFDIKSHNYQFSYTFYNIWGDINRKIVHILMIQR